MPLPPHSQTSNRNLPRRVDSLTATKGPYFFDVEDELRDVRRVHAQGQEEDLRYALSRTMNRMEELMLMLKEAYKVQTDLQTELTLAKSNLQLALANNEMLEDALRRDPEHSKDVGWRRMSAREQNLKAEEQALAQRRRSSDSLSTDYSASPTLPHPHPSPAPEPIHGPLRSSTVPSPAPSSESRFFRFRFGNSAAVASSSHPSSPRASAGQSPLLNGSHLTSASLPSLVAPRDWDKEVEELQHQLEAERKAHKQANDAKTALEGELESLSQALFEEANKMVATERRKRAETEEALREAREQGEALKGVLRLFERDSVAAQERPPAEDGLTSTRSRHRASSSALGIKSPSSGIPSPRSDPGSPAHISAELPSSARTVTIASSSTEPAQAASAPSDTDTKMPADPEISMTVPISCDSPSPPIPAPSSALGKFFYTSSGPVNYYDSEESPWADVASTTSSSVTL